MHDFEGLSTARIVTIYNSIPNCGVKKFENRAVAVARTSAALDAAGWILKGGVAYPAELDEPAPAKPARARNVRPHAALKLIRPDEIAECWEGVPAELGSALWRVMEHAKPYTGETPPEPDVNCTAKFWAHFTDEERTALNKLAAARDAELHADETAPAERVRWTPKLVADMRAAAKAGTLPTPPDFSKPTHDSYRKKLETAIALAEAGRADELDAMGAAIIPGDSSRKPLKTYIELCVIALRADPKAPAFHLTENELKAAFALVKSCLDGMGGSRPSDLERDEFTWVSASDLRDAGWDKHSAEGTFGALVTKGVVRENNPGEFFLVTAAWRWLDTIWGAA